MIRTRSVSTRSAPWMNAKLLGVATCGSLIADCTVYTTSSAVNGLPSWNTTFGRSSNSIVVSSTYFQLVANNGFNCSVSGSR